MAMILIFGIFSLCKTIQSATIGIKDGNIDPGTIIWPQETWCSTPIQPYQSTPELPHALKIQFRPSTTILNGILQVLIAQSILGTYSMDIIGNQDNLITVPMNNLYGGIWLAGITTRSSITGQIYDVNYAFTFLYANLQWWYSQSFSMQSEGNTNSNTIGSSIELLFILDLPISLWKHDIIEIIPDSSFGISTNISCNSVSPLGKENFLYGLNGDHSLFCLASSSFNPWNSIYPDNKSISQKSVYIFGIDDVYQTNWRAIIRVSGFTLPLFTYSSSGWNINIWRWGTGVAQWRGYSGLNMEVLPGPIHLKEWKPVSSIPVNDVAEGSTIFTKLTFETTHDIPKDGRITINFKNVDIKSPTWWQDLNGENAMSGQCYLNTYIQGASCYINNSTSVGIYIGPAKQSARIFEITLLATISIEAKVASVTSSDYWYSGMVDSSSEYLLWPVNVTNAVMKTLRYHAYDSNIYPNIDSYFSKGQYNSNLQAGAVLDKNYFLFFMSQPGVLNQWNETTLLKIMIPFSNSSIQLTKTYIGSSSASYYACDDLTGKSSVTINAYTDENANFHRRIPGSSGEIVVYFNNISPGCIPFSNQYYIFGFSAPSNSSIATISLPMVQSNLATFYEIWAKAETGTLVDIGSYVFSVMRTAPISSSQFRTLALCSDITPRIPLYHIFTPLYVDYDFTSKETLFQIQIDMPYYITFKGVDIGEDFPVYSNSTGSPKAIKIGGNSLIISGLGKLAANSAPVEFFIPNYSTFSWGTSTSSLFYVTPKDPSTIMMIYRVSAWMGLSDITKFGAKPAVLESFEAGASGSLSITNLILQNTKPSSGIGDYIGIILPQGFDVVSETLILGEIECKNYIKISSAGDYFDGTFIIVRGTDSVFLSNSTAKTLTILGVKAANHVTAHSPTPISMGIFLINSQNYGLGASCDASYSFNVYMYPGTISQTSCLPLSIPVRGPDSVDVTIIIAFNTTHEIPGDGIIHISLDSSWKFTDSDSCYSPDLADYDSDTHVECIVNIITGELELSGFSAVSIGSIRVYIDHTLPPISLGLGTANCAQVIYTLDSYGNYIDYGAHLIQNVALTESLPAGKTSQLTAFAYPNFPEKVADISLVFSLTKALPIGSIIQVYCGFSRWIDTLIWIQEICYSSFDYLSCKYIDGTIQLVTNVKIPALSQIEIYIETALVLPKYSGPTSSGFQITTFWSDIIITQDSAPGFLFTIGPKVTSQTTLSSITFNGISNSGHLSSYNFYFSSSEPVEIDDYFVIQFPKAFNPYIGEVTYSDCSPNILYLPCSSSSLINPICNPDHWYLKVSGLNVTKSAGEPLDLTIDNIWNPAGSTYKFNIFHYNPQGWIKAYQYSSTPLSIPSFWDIINLKNVSLDDPTIGAVTNYYFKISNIPCCGLSFLLQFPDAYDLAQADISCSFAIFAESDEQNSHNWTKTDCSWNKTSVKFSHWFYTNIDYINGNLFIIKVEGVHNPEWGYKRDGGWDVELKAIFGDYSLWSDRFSVLLFWGNQFINSCYRSYPFSNPSYVGFKLNDTAIRINQDIDKPPKIIKLLPGIQSEDLTVLVPLTWPLKSKSLILTPSISFNNSNSDKLVCNSAFHKWTIRQMDSSITFRISVLSDTSPGYYYIDWSLTETLQEGVSNPIYQVTSQTIVEICNKTSSVISIEVSSISTLFVGYTSIPIAVTVSNSPASDIKINIAINPASTDITVTPSSLVFNPDINILYFKIDVSSSYNIGQTSPTLSFTVEGTDSKLFIPPSPITLKISSTLPAVLPEFSISHEVLNGNEAVFNITANQNGVLYWSISCITNNFIPNFIDLHSLFADLATKTAGTLTLKDQLMRDYKDKEIDINKSKGDTDVYSFFSRVYAEHCSNKWYSSEVIYANKTKSIDLSWLMEGTWYTFVSYFDNGFGKNIQKIINFTTPSLSEISTISVNFDADTLSLDQGDSIRYSLAKNMGINPSWLSNEKINIDPNSIKFSYEILYDRSKSLYSSSDILNNFNQVQGADDIKNAVGQSPTFTKGKISVPSWAFPIVLSNISPQNATFIAASTSNGEICTSCSKISSKNPTYGWQVINKLDGDFNTVSGTCISVSANTNTSIAVTGLSEWNTYYCYFTACSDFSLWNICMDYEENTPLQEFIISTTNTSFNGSIDCADPHCQICSAQGQCSQCFPPTHYLDNSYKCSLCGDKKYSDGIQCYSCSNPDCNICSGPSQCSTCSNLTLHPDNAGGCILCPDGEFSNNDGSSCLLCSDNCKTCRDISTTCTSCYSGFLFNNSCIHSCPAGYYYSSIIGTCDKCNYVCKECIYASTNCTACYPGFTHYPNTCKLACVKGTYFDGLQCQPCSTNCATCSDKPNNCTSCAGYYKYSYGNACFSTCPADISITSGYTCKNCTSPCATCKGVSTNCTSCVSPLYLYQGNCVESCPQYYTPVSVSGVITCIPPCPQGKILNSLGTCDSCDPSCSACSGTTTYCLKCSGTNLYAYQGNCISSCPKDITVAINGQCQSCSSSCLTCSVSTDNCTSCPTDTYLWGKQCLTACPDGYLASSQNGINVCIQCDSACETCAETTTKCTSCKLGSYKLVDTCYKCGVLCASCSSSMECDYCEDPSTQTVDLDNDPGSCICVGPTYYDVKVCKSCGQYCLACNSTACNKCVLDSMILATNNPSDCLCDGASYYDGEICQSCGEHCSMCNQNQCTKCSVISMITDPNNNKNCLCPPGSYYNHSNDKCWPCNSKCAICSSYDQCSQCSQASGMSLSLNYPGTCECDAGWADYNTACANCSNTQYWGGYECLNCIGLCSSCTSQTECTSCKTHSSLSVNNTCMCDDGYIQDKSQCLACPSLCSVCANQTSCITCRPNSAFDSDNKCQCNEGFQANSSGYCVAICAKYCQTCDENNGSKCLTCIESAELFNNSCSCTENSYYEPASNSCQCQLGYALAFNKCVLCRKYLSQGDIKSSSFDGAFTYIHIDFSANLDTSLTSCSKIFTPYSYSKMGKSPSCSYPSQRSIKIMLGAGFTQWNDIIYLDGTYLLKSTSDPCTTNYEPLTTVPTIPPSSYPVVVLTGPKIVSLSCGTVFNYTTDQSTGNLGGIFTYIWSATIDPQNTNFLLKVNSNSSPSMAINANWFNKSQSYSATLNATLTNLAIRSSWAALTVQFNSIKSLAVQFEQGDNITVYSNKETTLKAKVVSTCDNSTNPIAWGWQLVNSKPYLSLSLGNETTDKLIINALTFKPGGTYLIQAFATQVTNGIALTGSANININVGYSPLDITLSKTSGDISSNQDFYINATGSDPDNPNSTFSYSWVCKNHTDGSDCKDKDNNLLIINEISQSLTIPSSKFIIDSTWDITCQIRLDNRIANKTVTIHVLNSNTNTILAIPASSLKVSSSQIVSYTAEISSDPDATLQWTLYSDQDLTISPDYLPTLTIPADTLSDGETYVFQLAVDDGSAALTAQLTVEVNAGAICTGSTEMNPGSGTALVDLFTVSISGCYDRDAADYPLIYTFRDTWDGQLFTLGYTAQSSQVITYLFAGYNQLSSHVCDQLSGCTDYPLMVNIWEYTSRRYLLSGSLTDAYLRNTIDKDNIPSTIVLFCNSAEIDASLFSKMWEDLVWYMQNYKMNNNLLSSLLESLYAISRQQMQMNTTMYNSFFEVLHGILANNTSIMPSRNDLVNIVSLGDNYRLFGNYTNYEEQSLEQLILIVDNLYHSWMTRATKSDLPSQSSINGNQNTPNTIIYKNRDFSFKMQNETYEFGENRKIIYPATLSFNNNDILNLWTKFYNTSNSDYSDIVSLKLTQSGTYNNFILKITDERDASFHTGSNPFKVEMPIYKDKPKEEIWVCNYYDEAQEEWTESHCNVADVKNNSVTIEVYHFSMYKISARNPKSDNYAPVYIVAGAVSLTSLTALIMVIYDKLHNKSLKIEESPDPNLYINSQVTGRNDEVPQRVPAKVLISETDRAIIEDQHSQQKESDEFDIKNIEDIQIKGEEKKFKSLWREHLTFGLFCTFEGKLLKLLKLLTLLEVLLFEFAAEGLFFKLFEDTDIGTDKTTAELFADYDMLYFIYIMFALIATLPVEIFETKILMFNGERKNKWLIFVTIVDLLAILGSIIGILYFNKTFDHDWNGYWAISFIWGLLIEVFIIQNLLMFLRHYLKKNAGKSEDNY